MEELQIDKEFCSLIPPLTTDELHQLEENVLVEGCRDALIVWKGIIIDGHNRYQICGKHNITFKTVQKDDLKNRDEVKEWIIRNQFGRRNLSAYDRSKLSLQLETLIKARAREKQLSNLKQGTAVPQKSAKRENDKPIETREELAKIAGVSRDTIDKVRIIEHEANLEQKARLSRGEAKVNTIYRELRPKMGDKPVKQPDTSKTKGKEVINKELPGPESGNLLSTRPTIISVAQIEDLVYEFLNNAMPFALMFDQIQLFTEFEKKQIDSEIDKVEQWIKIFRKALKNKPIGSVSNEKL